MPVVDPNAHVDSTVAAPGHSVVMNPNADPPVESIRVVPPAPDCVPLGLLTARNPKTTSPDSLGIAVLVTPDDPVGLLLCETVAVSYGVVLSTPEYTIPCAMRCTTVDIPPSENVMLCVPVDGLTM